MRRVEFNKDYVTGLVNGVLSTSGIPNDHYEVEIKTCDGMDHIILKFDTDTAMKDINLFDISFLQHIVRNTFDPIDEPNVIIKFDRSIDISFLHEKTYKK